MTNNKYIIKNLAPWMINELAAFSKITDFEIIFLRKQDEFYHEDIQLLLSNDVSISVEPFSWNNFFRKFIVVFKFFIFNLFKFRPDYNFVIGVKSIIWFLRLDISKFSSKSNIHAQFATQAALVSLLVKKYFNNTPQYSFTFHAHDIYFDNKWFELLVTYSKNAFSISNYNIEYVKNNFLDSKKITLSRLGVFRNQLDEKTTIRNENFEIFTLGLISWFTEKKGIQYLLDAMLNLKKEGIDNIKLILAGDGPLKNELLEFITNNDLEDSVHYIGKIKKTQKHDFFSGIDAFVLPSISLKKDKDGIPVVLMEAIAYKLPLISTEVSGIPEICINNYNGLLIPEKNVKAIVESILELSNNKLKRKTFSKNSLKFSAEYDIQLNSLKKVRRLGWNANAN